MWRNNSHVDIAGESGGDDGYPGPGSFRVECRGNDESDAILSTRLHLDFMSAVVACYSFVFTSSNRQLIFLCINPHHLN